MIKNIILVLIILCLSIVPLSFWVCSSYYEARAYSNVTGKKVSTFDAMFLELRVTND